LKPLAGVRIFRTAIFYDAHAESFQSTKFAKRNEICKTIKNPEEGYEEDKCAV
jgi:hypothetical protein